MSDQREAADTADTNGVRDFEFTISEVCAAGSNDKRKVVRNMKMLSVIHTHPNQQLGVGE
jgi:hypothetical protein